MNRISEFLKQEANWRSVYYSLMFVSLGLSLNSCGLAFPKLGGVGRFV